MLWMSQVSAPVTPVYLLTLADVFLLFFIMIGPIKSIGPFAAATAALTPPQLRATALKVYAISAVTLLIVGLIGGSLIRKWHIDLMVLQLAAGLVFLLVALQLVLAQYRTAAPEPAGAAPTVAHLAFPITLPAYGIAAVIVLAAMSVDTTRFVWILVLSQLVLVLDLLMMLFVRPLLRWMGTLPLQVLGAVLGILQVALALQMIVSALRQSHVLPLPG